MRARTLAHSVEAQKESLSLTQGGRLKEAVSSLSLTVPPLL